MIGDVEVTEASVEVGRDVSATGESAKGEFRCAHCGYGITVYRTLPSCPMCAGNVWQPSPWSPFARSRLAGDL